MSWSFGSIIEVEKGVKPYCWYIRYTMVEGVTGEQRSDYVKFQGTSTSTRQDARDFCAPIIARQINQLNNPPTTPPVIPEVAPIVPGLTGPQQTGLVNAWPVLKPFLRDLIGRQ